MNMQFIDWTVLFGVLIAVASMAVYTKRFTKSVADFLAANRSAGRYLITMSEAMQGVGAISIVAMFEVYYEVGFTTMWWRMMLLPAVMSFLGVRN